MEVDGFGLGRDNANRLRRREEAHDQLRERSDDGVGEQEGVRLNVRVPLDSVGVDPPANLAQQTRCDAWEHNASRVPQHRKRPSQREHTIHKGVRGDEGRLVIHAPAHHAQPRQPPVPMRLLELRISAIPEVGRSDEEEAGVASAAARRRHVTAEYAPRGGGK